jgi:endonuclease III
MQPSIIVRNGKRMDKPTAKEVGIVLKILNKKTADTMLEQFSQNTPYYILISTVLSARNRDDQTIKAVKLLFSKFKNCKEIAEAPVEKLEPLLRLTGFYKTKARRIKELSQILLERHGGKVPKTYEELTALPGVGRKTAGCVLVYAFRENAVPVDTHVHRVSNRLGWVNTRAPLKTEEQLLEVVPKRYWQLVNEGMVIHGQKICNPIIPKCSICPIRKYCPRIGVTRSK